MTPRELPGPIYAIGPDPRQPDWKAFVFELTRAISGGKRVVVLFTDLGLARQWMETHSHPNPAKAYKPFGFTDLDEFVGFLNYLAEGGDTHVGLDPAEPVVGLVPIREFAKRLLGTDLPHGQDRRLGD
jgi:hypothetical protein